MWLWRNSDRHVHIWSNDKSKNLYMCIKLWEEHFLRHIIKSHISLIDHCMRFQVVTAVKMSISVFWIVTPGGLVGKYQLFGGTYCLHLQALCFSEILVSTCESTQCYKQKTNITVHCCESVTLLALVLKCAVRSTLLLKSSIDSFHHTVCSVLIASICFLMLLNYKWRGRNWWGNVLQNSVKTHCYFYFTAIETWRSSHRQEKNLYFSVPFMPDNVVFYWNCMLLLWLILILLCLRKLIVVFGTTLTFIAHVPCHMSDATGHALHENITELLHSIVRVHPAVP
jgi:hypothetical protein